MAFVVADRVKETTTTAGTGAVTLAGAVAGFQSFAVGIGNSNTTYYTIASQTATEWEVGYGTLNASSTVLTRTTVLASSNNGSLVSFSAGTKEVFVTQPATRTLVQANGGASTNGVLFYTGSGVATATSALTFDGTNFATTGSATAGSVTTAGTVTATGTATAASLIPTSSTAPTNGMYLPAANTVGFATNSAGVVYINASGNLLVGTATNGKRLTVSDSIESTATFIRTDNTVGNEGLIDFQMQNSSNAAVVYAQIGSSINANTAGAVNGSFVINTANASVVTEKVRVDNAGNVQVQAGAVMSYSPTPLAVTGAINPLTNANLQTQILSCTGTAPYTLTMPLGTTLDTLADWSTTNIAYDFIVINGTAGTVTVAVNTGVTNVGTLTVLTGISARFRIRRTAASTYILYRI
jgi:hypothetical protein